MQSIRDRLEIILSHLANRVADERAYTKLYADAARAAADASDARKRAGVTLGTLDGTIVSIKDLFDVAGEATTAGSLMLRSAPPAVRDAAIVSRLRQAGAVIIGKTNMTEFAFTAIGDNQHYGTPGNAADASRIPGGSSSGAGVSVGEGTSEISIGSDTGGSIRIPASLNGVVGFKPTARRVPLTGAFPLSGTLDSIGPLARSVAQCAVADAVMAGEEPAALTPIGLSGLRVGIPRGVLFGDTESEVAAAFERQLQPGPRLFLCLCLCGAGPEDRFQHLVGIVAVDHRTQELADGVGAFRSDIAQRPVQPVGLQARQLGDQRLTLGGGEKQALPPVIVAGSLHDIPFIEQLLEHPAQRLLGDIENIEQVRHLHAGVARYEMHHAVMGAAEAEFRQRVVGIAHKVAIGEEQ